MKVLINASLILVIALVSLSAYLRLTHSGIGCAQWPQCYGHIGDVATIETTDESQTAYQEIVDQKSQPLSWATPLHRLVASTLGLLIIFLNLLALKNKKSRFISFCLLGLTVYLAVLGIRSGSLYDPAVIMGNLSGGFLMLGLLGWLAFTQKPPTPRYGHASLKPWAIIALVAVSLQILLGGLTSANFAATACQTIPDCHGSWLPDAHLGKAFDLSRQHQVSESGIVIGGAERMAIHKLHRIGAILSLLLLIIVGVLAIRTGGLNRFAGTVIVVLVILEFTVGVLAVASDLPILLAVSHNWLSGLLVLALLWLLAIQRSPA